MEQPDVAETVIPPDAPRLDPLLLAIVKALRSVERPVATTVDGGEDDGALAMEAA